MITDDYVNFEIAKLLKEKGFNVPCRTCYLLLDKGGHTEIEMCNGCLQGQRYDSEDSSWKYGILLLRPTLQMAIKWLRKKHNIIISIDYSYICEGYKYSISLKSESLYLVQGSFTDYDYKTYESACETAIKWCLTNLI